MIGKMIMATFITLPLTGALYQNIATKRDESRFPPPGELVDVNGHHMHIYSTGKGQTNVILDAGGGCDSSIWSLVQDKASHLARIHSYDRFGLGWSDKATTPRTAGIAVKELRTLLINKNITPPYVLVGHSLGGLHMRLFANLYPQEVKGLILVDSAHENQYAPSFVPKQSTLLLQKYAACFGALRFLNPYKESFQNVPQNVADVVLSHAFTWKQSKTTYNELRNLAYSFQQIKSIPNRIHSIPLTVIHAGQFDDPANRPIWEELQKDLASKSSKSKIVVAEKSDHKIPLKAPKTIALAIKEMIA